MSSSRSAASVRAKRAGPQPEQTFGRASGPGPVTSIGSTQIFNSGGNTTGANARIHGTSGSSGANSASFKTPVARDMQEGPVPTSIPGGKMSVNSAIALITTRLGRLELFMHQYHLEDRGGSFSEEPILTRLSELENVVLSLKAQVQVQAQSQAQSQSQPQTQKTSKEVDSGNNLMLLTRISSLEKHVSSSNSTVQSSVFNGLKSEVEGVKSSVSSFSEEIKELKDMLLRLQTYTMETNAKLVNTVFPLYDTVNVQDFDNGDDFLYAQEVDDLCYSDDQADDYLGDDAADETDRLIDASSSNNNNNNNNNTSATKNGISVTYNECSSTFTPNLKELINQELMNCSSRI